MTLLTSVIVATIGLVASVLTGSLSYFFSKRQQFMLEERRLKEQHYIRFIKAISSVAIDSSKSEAQEDLSDAFNSLLLVANPKVIEKLMEFHNFVRIENQAIPRDSHEWSAKHDALLTELITAMRADLFHKKEPEVLPEVHLVGRR